MELSYEATTLAWILAGVVVLWVTEALPLPLPDGAPGALSLEPVGWTRDQGALRVEWVLPGAGAVVVRMDNTGSIFKDMTVRLRFDRLVAPGWLAPVEEQEGVAKAGA